MRCGRTAEQLGSAHLWGQRLGGSCEESVLHQRSTEKVRKARRIRLKTSQGPMSKWGLSQFVGRRRQGGYVRDIVEGEKD
jgi:hypothetical protein